MFTCKKQT